MTIVIVLTIVICYDSRIMMSQNITVAHLYRRAPFFEGCKILRATNFVKIAKALFRGIDFRGLRAVTYMIMIYVIFR